MALPGLFKQGVKIDTANATRGPSEAPLDDVLSEPDRLKNLRTFILLQRRDAHLAHYFQHPFTDSFSEPFC